MKKNQHLLILGLLLLLMPKSNYAQWQFPLGAYGRLNIAAANQSIGIGRFPLVTDMRAKLHVDSWRLTTSAPVFSDGQLFRTDGDQQFENNWQMWTGTGIGLTTEKFRLFNPATSNDIGLQTTQAGSMNFLTNSAQRMTIRGANNSPYIATGLSNVGYVGIGTTAPGSPLHVVGDNSPTGLIIPSSNWSNGIMISNHGTLIFEGDRANINNNRDFFIAHPSFVPQGDLYHGLIPGIDGNQVQYVYHLFGQSRVGAPVQGVHEFLTTVLADVRVGVNTLFPSQRVESVDATNQQLRLTQTQNTANAALGTWTDFQTTLNPANVASLYIHPSSDAASAGTAVNGFVGINDATPSNTLEITSTPGISPEASGLRLTNLISTSPSSGTFSKFLTVDPDGDVILGDQTGSGGGVTACAGGLLATNYITKITNTNEICKTAGIWEDPSGANNVGIGTTTPVNKLHVNGDINVSSATNVYRAQGFKILGLAPASSSSTLVGRDAGGVDDNTTMHAPDGTDHTIIGYQAGYNMPHPLLATPTIRNTFVGRSAGYLVGNGGITNGQGQDNTLVGTYCAQNITTGSGNTAMGFHSGSSDNTYGAGTGNYNASVGYEALTFNTSGDNNAGIGKWTLLNNRTGSENVGVGNLAGAGNFTGSNNTFIGSNSNCSSSALTYATAIGAGSAVATSSTVAIGRSGDQVVVAGSTPVSTHALTVYGEAYKTSGTADWIIPSDMLIKKDTSSFTDGLNVIRNTHPINFTYRSNFMRLDTTENKIGISAEEMALIAPYTVDTIMTQLDSMSQALTPVLTFNRNGLFYAAINAIKELDFTNQQLINQMNLLQARLDACCSVVAPGPGGKGINPNPQSIELKKSESVILKLGDAVPNPFAEHTTISYTLPEEIKQVQIIFYESSGKVLRTVDISTRGNGELTVYAPDLSSGIYQYSLIADGKLVETKRMIKAN